MATPLCMAAPGTREERTLTHDRVTLGRRLKEARTHSGFTQEEVAKALELPRTAIVHMEAGNRSVSTLELAKLAEGLSPARCELFRGCPCRGRCLGGGCSVSKDFEENTAVRQELARCVAICQEGANLERLLKLPSRTGPPAYELSLPKAAWQAVQQGERIAADERRRLALGRAPIPDIAELARHQGIWACGAELPDQMSGLFLKHSSLGMVILVSSEHVRERRRFSYAHEYGHAIMDRDQNVTVTTTENQSDLREVRANAFAAAFLLPRSGVLHFLMARQKGLGSYDDHEVYDPSIEERGPAVQVRGRVPARTRKITYEDVAALAHEFGVSYQAAAYRLNSLRLVTRSQLRDLIEKADFGRDYLSLLKLEEDLEPKDSRPDRKLVSEVVHLAIEAYRRGEISKGKLRDLSSLLHVPGQELLRLAEVA